MVQITEELSPIDAGTLKIDQIQSLFSYPKTPQVPESPCQQGPVSGAQPANASGDLQAGDARDEELNRQIESARRAVQQQTQQLLAADASLPSLPLSELNKRAAALLKGGNPAGAAATYQILFAKAAHQNLTHPELHICHANAAAACLELSLFDEALRHAEHSRRLAEASLRRSAQGAAGYVKALVRKGRALLGLRRHREAAATFDSGLKVDPFNADLKTGLQEANQGVLRDLQEGRGRETRAITFPAPSQRITTHPFSAPLHRIRTEDMLPVRLLTPFQAENDPGIKDTYNFMTVQADVRMPRRELRALQDSYLTGAWRKAVEGAVADAEAEDKDCRVLSLGAGAGVAAAVALRAGARHVTAVERWLYLALACKETLQANKCDPERYSVVYKRPTDLQLHTDVPVCCNLVLANIMDEGLLTSGIIPAVTHALSALATADARLIPASATVYAQAIELRTGSVAGLDMSAANLYRWHPAYAAGVPLDLSAVRPLSRPVEAWYFDFGSPPERSDTKTLDLEFVAEGRFNAVMFWYKLHLHGDVFLSSGPDAAGAAPGRRHLQPALQYLAGELRVDPGGTLPLLASHNTVRMRFDIETADYLHLMKPDASFPQRHFEMLADGRRLEAYGRAIGRAVAAARRDQGEAHVLDVGTGCGALALLAARAGADSVVACDLHESLCDVARKAAAANGLSSRVSVVHRDVGLLQRGREVRPLGVNVVVTDMFDPGLFGDQLPALLDLARRKVVQPGAAVVPAAATLYCMGIEALTGRVEGVDVSGMNKFRWDAEYEGVRLAEVPHRRLTRPVKVLEHFFDGERRPRARESVLKLEVVAPGLLNAVVFWFDLHLDDVETLSNAPSGIGEGGVVLNEQPPALTGGDGEHSRGDPSAEPEPAPEEEETAEPAEHYWGQALQYLDRVVAVEPGRKVMLLARRDGAKVRFSLRQGVGEWAGRAPWKVEWGGGASVENPHFQRVHYCDLLVRDFLQRCRSKRFPSVERDVSMVLAHCGSLLLDAAAVSEAGHELVVLERMHAGHEFSPGASLEALTRRPLRTC